MILPWCYKVKFLNQEHRRFKLAKWKQNLCLTIISNLCCLQTASILYLILPRKQKNIIYWKSILLQECMFHSKIIRVSFHSPAQSSFNLVPEYTNQVFLLHICSPLTLEDRTELVKELCCFLVPSGDWSINNWLLWEIFTAVSQGWHFLRQTRGFSRGLKLTLNCELNFFILISCDTLALWEGVSCNFQANMIHRVINLLWRLFPVSTKPKSWAFQTNMMFLSRLIGWRKFTTRVFDVEKVEICCYCLAWHTVLVTCKGPWTGNALWACTLTTLNVGIS